MPPLSAWSRTPTQGMHLNGGTQCFSMASDAQENLGAGMKLALLLQGEFALQIDGHNFDKVKSATSTLFLSRNEWRLGHHFPAGTKLQYITLFLDASLIEDLLEHDMADSLFREPVLHSVHAISDAMASIATSILHRPFTGSAGRLHESGKALELAALAIDALALPKPRSQSSLANSNEVRRLHQLRDYLDTHWHDSAPADVLARTYGFGLRRMSVGFRRLFGCTISEYLREKRLQEAWKLLDSGMSATLTAEKVGYTLPHFTIAFTRRFGVTPGSLTRHGIS